MDHWCGCIALKGNQEIGRAFLEPGPPIGSNIIGRGRAVGARCARQDALHHTHWLTRGVE